MGSTRRGGGGPFAGAAPAMALAATSVAGAFFMAVSGVLPGGRWPVVHIVTLGVVSPLVLAFSHHFTRSVTHQPAAGSPLRLVFAFYAAALLIILGRSYEQRWAVAVGATATIVVVLISYVRLRRMRRADETTRFAWLIRAYERAHGAFFHGAFLGLLLGIGVLPGAWYGTARLAHLHALVAGWVGITILATVVFFGPAMLRTRIRDGAEATAALAIRRGMTGLSVAVIALVLSALPSPTGTVFRVVAAVGLLGFALAALTVARITFAVVAAAQPSPVRGLLRAATGWLAVVAFADAAVVTAGAWLWLDALGVVFGVGVAGQLILGVVLYLLPGLRGRSFAVRDVVARRIRYGARLRVVAINVVTVALALAAVMDGSWTASVWRSGWAVLAALALSVVMIAVLPVAADGPALTARGGRTELPLAGSRRFD